MNELISAWINSPSLWAQIVVASPIIVCLGILLIGLFRIAFRK